MSRRTYDLFWMSKTLSNLEACQLELKNHYPANSAYMIWRDQLFRIKEVEKAIFEDTQISLENLKEFDRKIGISELSGQYNSQKRKYSTRRALHLEEVVLIESILSGRSTSHVQKSKRYQEAWHIDIGGPVGNILAADNIYQGGDITISISSNTLRGCVIIGILFGVSMFGGFLGALGGAFLGAVVFSFSPQGKNMDELQIVSSKTLPGSVMIGTISTVVITKFVMNGISSIISSDVDLTHMYAF